MREPWQLENEHPEVTRQRREQQMESLRECNETYLDKIKEQRFIISRLGSEKAQIEEEYLDMLAMMGTLSDAVMAASDFIDDTESYLWDILGDSGLRELRDRVCIIEVEGG